MKLTKKHIAEQYCDDDGYWIYLKPGWKHDMDPIGAVHLIHEDTEEEAMREGVMKCKCPGCVSILRKSK